MQLSWLDDTDAGCAQTLFLYQRKAGGCQVHTARGFAPVPLKTSCWQCVFSQHTCCVRCTLVACALMKPLRLRSFWSAVGHLTDRQWHCVSTCTFFDHTQPVPSARGSCNAQLFYSFIGFGLNSSYQCKWLIMRFYMTWFKKDLVENGKLGLAFLDLKSAAVSQFSLNLFTDAQSKIFRKNQKA